MTPEVRPRSVADDYLAWVLLAPDGSLSVLAARMVARVAVRLADPRAIAPSEAEETLAEALCTVARGDWRHPATAATCRYLAHHTIRAYEQAIRQGMERDTALLRAIVEAARGVTDVDRLLAGMREDVEP